MSSTDELIRPGNSTCQFERSQVRRYRARCVVFEILGVGVPSRSHGKVGRWCGNVGGDPSYVLEILTHVFNFDT